MRERITNAHLSGVFKRLVGAARAAGKNELGWSFARHTGAHYYVANIVNGVPFPVSRYWETKREAHNGMLDMAKALESK